MLVHRIARAMRTATCGCTISSKSTPDVIVVGAGHNGLVASALLAREGLQVEVYEAKDVVGGACQTEYPFKKVPGLGQSTGAYLLGVMPPELLKILGINLPLIRRDPHYFLPTTGERHLLFGSDTASMKQQFLKFFSQEDWDANTRLQDELAAIRDDLAPAMMAEPLSVDDTAERYVRPGLRSTFVDLVREPVIDYLNRFGFRSELLVSMYAVTDGVVGIEGNWDTPGSGMNFLAHNMCRLPGSDGSWMVVKGGMGTVTSQLALKALEAGVKIHTGRPVESIIVEGGVSRGVVLSGGQSVRSAATLVNADPFRLQELAGELSFDGAFNDKLAAMKRNGTSLKLNMALRDLPKFSCLPETQGQHKTTIHLLPEEGTIFDTLSKAHSDAMAGRLPEFPAIEWYIHTTVDDSLADDAGHHSSALFVQWVPYDIQGSTWDEQEAQFAAHLLSICDRFAPGTSDLVADTFVLTPPKIEQHFGISRGHIHHIDNSFGFDERFPYATPVSGLYSASAGCHPAGSVMGCAGHNAAVRVLRDMGRTPSWTG